MKSGAPRHIFPAADLPPHIGTIIREIRCSAGLSQAELAACSGITRETIIRIERGTRPPLADTVLRLMSALLADQEDLELHDFVPAWPETDVRQITGHGPRSRARRRQLGLTLAEVARKAGFSESMLSRFERGAGPTPQLLRFEMSRRGEKVPRLKSDQLALALGFLTLAEHEEFCEVWH